MMERKYEGSRDGGGREKKDEVIREGVKKGRKNKELGRKKEDVKGKYGGKKGIRRGLNKDVVRQEEKEREYELRKWGHEGKVEKDEIRN